MKKTILTSIVFALFLLTMANLSLKGQFMKTEDVNCEIELIQDKYKASDQLLIKYSIHNTSNKTISLLKWNTPLEGINANIFNVINDDKQVRYIGKTIKRGVPSPDDYLTLEPDEVITVEINLGEAYDMSKSGDYSIQLNTILLDIGTESPEQLVTKEEPTLRNFSSNIITLKLTGDRASREIEGEAQEEDSSPKVVQFVECSANQKAILNTALSNAQYAATESLLVLVSTAESKRPSAKRYVTWFGKYDKTNYNKVISNFQEIYKALYQKTITFHCDCDQNYYAYVSPNKPYHIYICNSFWNAPDKGTDSKMGTIIHEVSHFYVVASTKDHVYGQNGAKNLAINNSSKAIENADSHEYFAENTPKQSMGMKLLLLSMIVIGTVLLLYFAFKFFRVRAKQDGFYLNQ